MGLVIQSGALEDRGEIHPQARLEVPRLGRPDHPQSLSSGRDGRLELIPRRIPRGERSDTLTEFGGFARRRGWSKSRIHQFLHVVNTSDLIEEPLTDDEVAEIARSTATYEPMPQDSSEPRVVDAADMGSVHDEIMPWVIEGLQYERGFLGLMGEEGEGKTLASDQLCRQLLRQEVVFGYFEPGELAPTRIMFVDTHQAMPEIRARALSLDRRSLVVPEGSLRFVEWERPVLTLEGNMKRLRDLVQELRPDYLFFDAASHLVEDAMDDREVARLFGLLRALMREHEIRGTGMTFFPWKGSQERRSQRRFDDLFGSREWKAQVSVLLHLDKNRLLVFKDRPGLLRRTWRSGQYPSAHLLRPGLDDPLVPPFVVVPADTSSASRSSAPPSDRIQSLVDEHPGEFTRNSLARELGGRKQDVLAEIRDLISEGRLRVEENHLFPGGSDSGTDRT